MRLLSERLWIIASYAMLAVISIVTIYPLVWMAAGSLKTSGEFYASSWALPSRPEWSNYRDAWTTANLGLAFVNSIWVTTITTVVLVLLSAMAAYAFARIDFPLKQFWFWLFLISMMVPTAVLIIPTFIVVKQFGLLDTLNSLILTYTAGGIAFGIFLMRAYFWGIPLELEEAALLDGASRFRVFWQIVLPLARPGLATLVIWHGLGSWNDFFVASILVRSPENRTWPLAIVSFVFERSTQWELMFAALTIATLPIVVLYIFTQRQFIQGLAAGAIKG